MKRSIYPLSIALILCATLNAQPTISSFTPLSGPVGTTVTINGTGFNNTPAQNTVYFGAVRAVISGATSTSLTVTVPHGASYQPLSVTTGGLTAYSSRPFTVTFTGGGFINESSFIHIGDSSAALYPYTVYTSDLDGDGNPDLVTANKDSNSVSILRNTTSGGVISFAYKISLPTPFNPYSVIAADLNGDGLQDLAVTTFNGFSVFKNKSTPGNIAFDVRQDFASTFMGFFRDITSGDYDSDGKPDIAIAEQPNAPSFLVLSVFRSISTADSILFAPKTSFATGRPISAFCLRTADMDNDGKADIPFSYSGPYASVMRNNTTPGNISFTPMATDISLYPGSSPRGLAIADMQGDGKPDLVIAEHFTDTISIISNSSTPGNISFDNYFQVETIGSPRSISVNDLDGDGKPDIAAVYNFFNFPSPTPVSVFKNNSTVGNLSIARPVYFAASRTPWCLALADFNADGKPDIATANSGGSPTVSLLQNDVGKIAAICPGGNATLSPNLTGSSYQWQMSTDSVNFTNLSDNSNYSGTNTATLQLIAVPSAWYGRQYRCVVDGTNSTPVTLIFTNYWTGLVSNNWENPGNWSCGSVPDSHTDVIIRSGTIRLNSNTSIRSLVLRPPASLTVNPGYTLTITH